MFDLKGHHRAAGHPAHLQFPISDLRHGASISLAISETSNLQMPTTREGPRLKHPTLRPWCLNLLWSFYPPKNGCEGRVDVGTWSLPPVARPSAALIGTYCNLFPPIIRFLPKKNPQFFTLTFIENHWEISENHPKNPSKLRKKSREICASINRQSWPSTKTAALASRNHRLIQSPYSMNLPMPSAC
jgi:hypothetical protein